MAGPVANLPNALTGLRFLLSFLFFLTLRYKGGGWMVAALGLLVVNGITDLLDGYLARKRGEETTFGRIADPFVDKVLICGAFIFLLARPEMTGRLPSEGVGLSPWMVMAIVAREFLVTGLRSYAESAGWSFPATWLGKSKMATQFACLCAALLYLAHFEADPWARWTLAGFIWLTVGITVGSCGTYVARFVALARSGKAP